MLSVRPRLGEQFVERGRLLERLPEEPGYIVWLQAPYGYGKSILAAQWASRLEAQDWRVVWVSCRGGDVGAATARALGMPANVPWRVVSSALWQRPTLLVLEDLAEDVALSPVLEDLGGLLLLAGREPLFDPGLLKLLASGHVVKLEAGDLAFDPDEALSLIPEQDRCAEALAISRGWPLPLHFTALTGRVPERRALLEGIRESVTPEAWREILFLAALPQLPDGAESGATTSLAAAGFVQHLEDGFRLHPLAAETVLGTYPTDVRDAVKAGADRLPPLLRGAAYEAAGLLDELGALLENAEVDLARFDAEAVLRWDERVPAPSGSVRKHRVGHALCLTGKLDEGVGRILESAASEGSADRKLDFYKDAVWWLASRARFEEALKIAETAEPYLGHADPEIVGRFLNNSASTYFNLGDWARAEKGYARALAYFRAGENSQRYVAETNLGIMRWHRIGDLDGLVIAREKAFEKNQRLNHQNIPGDLVQLGEMNLLLGFKDQALLRFCEAQRFARANPSFALIADGRRALVEGNVAAFPALWEQARNWQDPQICDRLLASWLMCLRDLQRLAEGLRVSQEHRGPWADPQRALILHASGRTAEARALLGEPPAITRMMEERLYWQAAKFQITLELSELHRLLGMTLVGARILPGLIPLAKLPADRPDLAGPYPLTQVLASGWKEAIELRLDEIPPLELKMLGRFKVSHLGRDMTLTGRHQEMLTLMTLGVGKEAMGEAIWPEVEAKKIKNNLYVHLNALRKTLEPWGVTTYVENVTLTRTRTDLWALEDALTAEDFTTVFDLYQGPLTPDVDVPLVSEARNTLHVRVVELLLKGGLMMTTRQGESYLRRVMDLDPLNELALQELLRRLVGSGRRSEAVRLFKAFSDRLKDELDIDPDTETKRIVGL